MVDAVLERERPVDDGESQAGGGQGQETATASPLPPPDSEAAEGIMNEGLIGTLELPGGEGDYLVGDSRQTLGHEPLGDEEEEEDLRALDIDDPHQLGRLGELIAVRYLRSAGYEVLQRNWRCRSGEVDVVARDLNRDETVLVEVKTRRNADCNPEDAVDESKLARYRTLSLEYLLEHECVSCLRFDVIAIVIARPGLARLRHILGASSWDS